MSFQENVSERMTSALRTAHFCTKFTRFCHFSSFSLNKCTQIYSILLICTQWNSNLLFFCLLYITSSIGLSTFNQEMRELTVIVLHSLLECIWLCCLHMGGYYVLALLEKTRWSNVLQKNCNSHLLYYVSWRIFFKNVFAVS